MEYHILWKIKGGDYNIWFDNWTSIGYLYNIIQESREWDDRVQLVKDLVKEG